MASHNMNDQDLAEILTRPGYRLSRENSAIRGDSRPAKSKQGNAAPERSEPVEPPQDAQGRVFTLELPLPPRECSRNTAVHWGTRARATREYREACGAYARAQLGKRRAQGLITIDFDFYLCRTKFNGNLYFPKDESNGLDACKAAVDSLQDTGLIKADTKKYVKIGTVNLYTTKKEHQGQTKLVMTIREA